MPAARAILRPVARSPASRRVVRVAFAVALGESVALGAAAWVTHSAAMRAQTATSLADVGVAVFLLIGVVRSVRPPDARHPLGYGREVFYWALFAAIGIFVGGGGVAVEEAVRVSIHPVPVGSYTVAYAVLAVTILLDGAALAVALAPLRHNAAARGIRLHRQLVRNTDPAATTVVVGNLVGVTGGLVVVAALAARQATGNPTPDALASALIGLMLMAGSVMLLRTNRELLTGRGVTPSLLADMRRVVAGQHLVLAVPDIFAVVIGPSSLLVNGDITFDDDATVPEVEAAISAAGDALRASWPAVTYVSLTPVAQHRPRSGPPSDANQTTRR